MQSLSDTNVDGRPELAIVIATHNRAKYVIENLTALLPQCSGHATEVVVVDSASAPDEAKMLQDFTATLPVMYIRVDEAGVSRARNAGVERTSAVWIAFLDDDAIPAENWLNAVLARTHASSERIGAIGGRVVPRWPQSPPPGSLQPSELGPRSLSLLSVLTGKTSHCTYGRPSAIGANMLVRRAAFDAVGGFPESIGAIGTSLDRGEDAWLVERIVSGGFDSWYDGEIIVDHVVHPNRLNKNWLQERFRSEGSLTFLRQQDAGRRYLVALKCLLSIPILSALSLRDTREREYAFRLQHNIGVLKEARREWRRSFNAEREGKLR